MNTKFFITFAFFFICQNVFANEQENIPSLYEINLVKNLSDDVVLNSVNGFDQAVMDVIPISLDVDAFKVQSNRGEIAEITTGQNVSITLPGEFGEVLLNVVSIEQDSDSNYLTYSGVVIDHPRSSFVLTSDKNRMVGQIVIKAQLFNVNSFIENDEVIHTLTWIDRNLIDNSHFKNDTSISKQNDAESKKSENKFPAKLPVTKSGGGSSVVRVLFLYANNLSDTRFKTKNIVNKMNTALDNSDLSHTISVADIQVLSTNFGTDCRFKIHDDMIKRNNVFSNLDTRMANAKADMVVTVAKGAVPITCETFASGTGRVGGKAELFDPDVSADNSDNRFTNFSDNYALGDLTALHEIGHVFGGLHALQSGTTDDPYPTDNNQAKVSTDKEEQTLVGGYRVSGCGFVYPTGGTVPTQSCVRIEEFSKMPAGTFSDSSATGSSTRNNAAYFDDTTMPEISGYASDPAAPSSAPTLSVTNFDCYGQNGLDWGLITLANSYQVYRSNYSNFASPVRVYTGFDNYLFANHTQDAYYRVKACNEGGCSGYSNQVFGDYRAGCF